MQNRFFFTLLVVALSCRLALPVSAQDPKNQEDTVRIATAAVQFEAVVTDKNGRPITGLTRDDFQVLDEGTPQPLDLFVAVNKGQPFSTDPTSSSAATRATTPLVKPFEGRYIAVIFDDLSLSADNFIRARKALKEYVDTKVTANDMVAIISTGGSLGSLQQFTNEKRRLRYAIDRISAQTSIAEKLRDPRFKLTVTEAVRIDSGDRLTLDNVVRRLQTEDIDMQSMPVESVEAQVRSTAQNLVTQLNAVLRTTLRTIENLSRGMGDLPGRKIVNLITESLTTAGGSSGDITNQMLQTIDVARRSGVSVYALDAGGVKSNNVNASERVTATGLQLRNTNASATFTDFENISAARALAFGTGGETFANANDLSVALEKATADSSSYYVLGFKPATLDNKFHRLTVTVKNKPDVVIRTRRGYLALNQETARGTATELAAALISPVSRTELPLEVVANVVPKGSAQVVVTGLHISRKHLTIPDPTVQKNAVYEVVAWVFAAGRDQPVGVIKTDVTYDLTNGKAVEKLSQQGFLMAHTFTDLAPGAYQIRAAVREKSTKLVGSAYQFFEIPDTSKTKVISLSSLVLTPEGGIGFQGHNSFKPGTNMELRYVIYNLKANPELVQLVKLVDSTENMLLNSRLQASTTPAPNDPSEFPQGTRLRVPTKPGQYSLFVILHDPKTAFETERRVDFVVE
jgi:VWFA-related protein